MKRAFSKILIFLVGIFYMTAAFEIEINDCKQTWGDEFDTYIVNVRDHHFQEVKQIKDVSYHTLAVGCTIHSPNFPEKNPYSYLKEAPISFSELYLRNAVLLI